MSRLIFKTWVWGFYRTYAGFLFILFLLFFGFLKGEEQLAIAQFLVADIKNLIYPALAVGLYGILLSFYSHHFLNNPKNRFLCDLIYLPGFQRLKFLLKGIHWLLFPATLYGIFLFLVALFTGSPMSAFLVFIFFIILKITMTLYFDRLIIRPGETVYGYAWSLSYSLGGKWSFTGFLIKHLILDRSLPLILTKLLSFLNIYVFSILIPTVDYLDRFLGIALFVAVLSNSLLPYEIFHFSFRRMTFLRNLPLRRSFIYLQIWVTTLILLLPEIIYIYRNFMKLINPIILTIDLVAALSLLVFLFSSQLIFNIDQRRFINTVFGILICIVFYLLFDLPVTILFIVLLSSSFFFFYSYFYHYEPEYESQAD